MTALELANRLNGREYRKEITKEEEKLAKESGLVVVFGASDDLAEFRGAFDDEFGAGKHTEIKFFEYEPIEEDGCHCKFHKKAYESAKAKVDFFWGRDGYSWVVETSFTSEPFVITDEGEPYCSGRVFNLRDLK